MTMYKIVRKFYRDAKAIETGTPCKVFEHPFTPLTLDEAHIIKPKLATPKNAIDHITAIEE